MTTSRHTHRSFLVAAASVTALAAGFAAAPQAACAADAPTAAEPTSLAEVVVTARRVKERLQDVPLSITAMDTQQLQNNRINQVQDIGAQVPNVITGKTSVPGAGTVAIRGVQGQGLPRPGLDNRVGVYLDGVYLARAQGQSFGLADIERIEVLKGPQGTLFGRNVTAGTINIITQGPTGKFGGIAEVGFGNNDRSRFRGTLNLPEMSGFSARLTYLHEQVDGDIKNQLAGYKVAPIVVDIPAALAIAGSPAVPASAGPPATPAIPAVIAKPASPAFTRRFTPQAAADTLGASKVDSVFVAVRYDGIENFTADYKFDFTRQFEVSPQQQIVGFSGAPGNGCFAAAVALGASTAPCGGTGVVSTPGTIKNVGGNGGYFVSTGAQSFVFGGGKARIAYDEFTAPSKVQTYGHNLTLNYKLGSTSLRSITAYRNLLTQAQSGADSGQYSLNNDFLTATNPVLYPAGPSYPAGGVTPLALGIAFTEQKQNQFSQEFQVFGPATSWLDYLVGAYYFREEASYNQTTVNNNFNSQAALLRAVNHTGGVPPYAPGGATNIWGVGSVAAGDASEVTATSKAIFGRLTFKPIENLDIVLGGRYTQDHKTSHLPQFMANFLDADAETPGQQVPNANVSKTFSKFTYDGTVTYHFNKNINVYGRYATAFLAGGFLRNTPFSPETAKAAELGFKSELFERRLRFNTAVFWQESQGYQFTGIVTGLPLPVSTATVVRNLGSATWKGGEAEVVYVPIRGLNISGSVGYTDQKYESPVAGVAPVNKQTPEWTLQGAVQYDTPAIYNEMFLSFRVDANYRSEYGGGVGTPVATSVGATGGTLPNALLDLYGLSHDAAGRIAYAKIVDEQAMVGGFWLANARVTLENVVIGGSKGKVSVYVRNLFNEEGKAFSATYGLSIGSVWVDDRRVGVDLSLSF
jgi:iron complex outermembrane receptor protein